MKPFWAAAERLGAALFLHPAGIADRRYYPYHLWNSIGQPLEEAMAMCSLFYEGVLDEFPRLKDLRGARRRLPALLPGRVDRNFEEKAFTRVNMTMKPSDYLRTRFWYDTSVYDPDMLETLIRKVGASRIMMGSDYPSGEEDPVGFVRRTKNLSSAEKNDILGRNAAEFLGNSQHKHHGADNLFEESKRARPREMAAARARRPFVIDFHAHVVIPEVQAFSKGHVIDTTPRGAAGDNPEAVEAWRNWAEQNRKKMFDVPTRVRIMDETGVDMQVLTPSLVHQYTYWAEPQTALKMEQLTNERIAEMVALAPGRFVGLGGVPLQAPELDILYMTANSFGGIPMALTMLDKQAEKKEKPQWPADIAAEFERESRNPNPCVGSTLLSENERTRVWIIRLAPGERIGFHRHVLDYFWTSVSGGRARQHVHDGTTVEYTYAPGETRHETYGKGEFKVHDLENLSDKDMVFMTVEFKDSANQPMTLPAGVRPQSEAA